jgi:hypothetical protein
LTYTAAALPRCGAVLATSILYSFPILECGFDRHKISRVGVVGMLFDGGGERLKPLLHGRFCLRMATF